MKRIIVIVVGCGLTWAAAAVGIGLAVRLHDRLREADVASAEVAPPDTAPLSPVAETIAASEEPVAEPAAESPAGEDKGRADARSPPARGLRLHPLEGPFSGPDRADLEEEVILDLPPAGIHGLRTLNLGWMRDGTLKLLVLLSTPANEYGRQIITEGALPNPTWAAFDTLPIGETLVIAMGWGIRIDYQDVACEHYTLVCRVGAGGVPSCAPPVLVARAPVCRPEGFGAGLPVAVPPIQSRRDYIGNLVLVDGVTFDVENMTFSPLEPAAWNRKTSDFQAQELGAAYTGIGDVRLFSKARQTRLRIELTTSHREFVGQLRRSRGPGFIGWLSHWAKSGTLLIGWNVGVGVLDPPESTFSACEQYLVVCRMDAHDVPWCSDAVTLARAAKCVEDGLGLEQELPDPTWDRDGRAFQILGRRFRVETPGWNK